MRKILLIAVVLLVGGCQGYTYNPNKAIQYQSEYQQNVTVPKMQYDIQGLKQQQFFNSLRH